MSRIMATTTLTVAILLLAMAPAAPADEVAIKEARTAALKWLQLVDAADYAKSWEQAAGFFKSQVTQAQWEQAARMARSQVGAFQKREHQRSEYKTQLPGAPPGEYVVLFYTSTFSGKAPAAEMVTLRKESDGSWRTVGYFVR